MTIPPTRLQAQCRIDTPLGPLTLAATPRGLAAALFDAQAHHPGAIDAPIDAAQPHLAQAAREFAAYFAGRRRRFDVALDAAGTPFQQQVWQALLAIDAGAVDTYAAVARRIGRPSAVRAVAAAIGRNPVAIVVPCHRVIGSDGSLTGYAAGLARKQRLLRLEGALAYADGASHGSGAPGSLGAVDAGDAVDDGGAAGARQVARGGEASADRGGASARVGDDRARGLDPAVNGTRDRSNALVDERDRGRNNAVAVADERDGDRDRDRDLADDAGDPVRGARGQVAA